MIKNPVPIIPIENKTYDRFPASGFKATAASLMVTIL